VVKTADAPINAFGERWCQTLSLIYGILFAMEKTRPIFYGVVDNVEEV